MCKKTFEHLDALLRRVSEDLTGALDWPPPPQEKECIAVATLNLLRLQVGNDNYVGKNKTFSLSKILSTGCTLYMLSVEWILLNAKRVQEQTRMHGLKD